MRQRIRHGNVGVKVIEYQLPGRSREFRSCEEHCNLMNEYKLYIDDQWVASSKGLIEDDINPADGSVFARVHWAAREDLERALGVAHERFASWKHSLPAEREKILCRAADILETRMQEFSEVLIDEGGSPFGKSMFEVSFVVGMLRSVAGGCRRTFGGADPSPNAG